jgi:hypothetical protein
MPMRRSAEVGFFGARAPASAATAVPIRPLPRVLASRCAYRSLGGIARWNGEQTAS